MQCTTLVGNTLNQKSPSRLMCLVMENNHTNCFKIIISVEKELQDYRLLQIALFNVLCILSVIMKCRSPSLCSFQKFLDLLLHNLWTCYSVSDRQHMFAIMRFSIIDGSVSVGHCVLIIARWVWQFEVSLSNSIRILFFKVCKVSSIKLSKTTESKENCFQKKLSMHLL